MKFLESAERLLEASQKNEAKSEKMTKAIATHKTTISFLQEAIAEAKGNYMMGLNHLEQSLPLNFTSLLKS